MLETEFDPQNSYKITGVGEMEGDLELTSLIQNLNN